MLITVELYEHVWYNFHNEYLTEGYKCDLTYPHISIKKSEYVLSALYMNALYSIVTLELLPDNIVFLEKFEMNLKSSILKSFW